MNLDKEKNHNPFEAIVAYVVGITRKAYQGGYELGKEIVSTERFDIDFLAKSFLPENPENFLTEKPLAACLKSFGDEKENLRKYLGTRITLTVLPCTLDGLEIPTHYLDDQKSNVHPYFHVLFSNPTDPRGLAIGARALRAAPYFAMQPEEIAQQCSFDIDFRKAVRESGETQADADYRYICNEIIPRYQRLQEIVKFRVVQNCQ